MRKLIAYLFLMIMLVVSIQPTLAMHFCGDNLYSISLPDPAFDLHSCNTDCGDMNMEHETSFNNIPCCSVENLEVKTDTYQTTQMQLDLNQQQYVVLELFPIFLSYLYEQPIIWDNISLQTLHKYPPQGLGQYTFDLLKNICIYRL